MESYVIATSALAEGYGSEVICTHPYYPHNRKYSESLNSVEIRRSDFVAVLHGKSAIELTALRHAAKAKPAYFDLLGSGNKARKHRE